MTATSSLNPQAPPHALHDAPFVALFDASDNGKIMVEGAEAARMLHQLWLAPERHLAMPEVGTGIEVDLGQVYRLRSDLFFVHTPPANEAKVVQLLAEYSQPDVGLITVTPVTHGRAELRLVASAGAEHRGRALLSRVCGLDFGSVAFPNMTARTTSLAKTRQLVIRRDQDGMLTYAIIGSRSLGAYLLTTLAEAGHDLGLVMDGDTYITGDGVPG